MGEIDYDKWTIAHREMWRMIDGGFYVKSLESFYKTPNGGTNRHAYVPYPIVDRKVANTNFNTQDRLFGVLMGTMGFSFFKPPESQFQIAKTTNDVRFYRRQWFASDDSPLSDLDLVFEGWYGSLFDSSDNSIHSCAWYTTIASYMGINSFKTRKNIETLRDQYYYCTGDERIRFQYDLKYDFGNLLTEDFIKSHQ
eukprot:Nk52_evm4s612 gene=Nk52_evmTU4s612